MSNLELLAAMIHGDQAGGLRLSKNNVVTTTVQDHLFQDGHPIDQEHKRFKKKTSSGWDPSFKSTAHYF